MLVLLPGHDGTGRRFTSLVNVLPEENDRPSFRIPLARRDRARSCYLWSSRSCSRMGDFFKEHAYEHFDVATP